ncbi:MAG: hydrogenase small subunit [Epsilonproteobacteria bacterium]|nr:hydrogenase small subunit [Campylobacterota bacterium]
MRIVVVGGGIAAAYLANRLKSEDPSLEVLILSEEPYAPYDRIHLCSLVNKSESLESISMPLDPTVRLELNQKITQIDPKRREVYSKNGLFRYDKLIIATGSLPVAPFDVSEIENAAIFRSAKDCYKIANAPLKSEFVMVGSGPIGLELLETLGNMPQVEKITLLVRGKHLYDKHLSIDAIALIGSKLREDGRLRISFEDEIVSYEQESGRITKLVTQKLEIEKPFLLFGIGIAPNIDPFRESLACEKGIVTNLFMQTSDENIYAVGECAEVEGFIAGHVKECTDEANIAVAHILGRDVKEFSRQITTDMLKTERFDLVDVRSPDFAAPYEKVLITSHADSRIDEYFTQGERLIRFVGINSNVDIGYVETVMREGSALDVNYLYQNRLVGERGRLICSCEHLYQKDLEDLVAENSIADFAEFGEYSHAGRVCGRCKKMVQDGIIAAQSLIDPTKPKLSKEEKAHQKEIEAIEAKVAKFNALHPQNGITSENFESALESLDIAKKELNSWVSMVTASMQLHPSFEDVVSKSLRVLNRVPIIWLELSDCSGNSEAFIKSTNPGLEELIFDYISLDYHELLMSSAGDASESALEAVMREQKGRFVLIVEGAVPLGMDGKYLRIGPKGETGLALLQKCAKDAALVIALGSCAYDGGVVAAAPNPTGAVGVAEALGRQDIINLPGCPTNPINIVGTLLSYLMFEELPKCDKFNRPLWAYEGRIHDNCERRGHYELGEFVKEWGDEGAAKGWCLFEMGCKGPYSNANCPTMKFNAGTSWPIQAGHGCMGCVEAGFFDKYANERKVEDEKDSD